MRFRATPDISTDSNVRCLLNNGDEILIYNYTQASNYVWAEGILSKGPSQFIGCTGYVATDFLYIYQV